MLLTSGEMNLPEGVRLFKSREATSVSTLSCFTEAIVSLILSTSLSIFFRSDLVGVALFSMTASKSPILAIEPSLAIIETTIPAAGAGTSESTLSVATSTRGSSSFT